MAEIANSDIFHQITTQKSPHNLHLVWLAQIEDFKMFSILATSLIQPKWKFI